MAVITARPGADDVTAIMAAGDVSGHRCLRAAPGKRAEARLYSAIAARQPAMVPRSGLQS